MNQAEKESKALEFQVTIAKIFREINQLGLDEFIHSLEMNLELSPFLNPTMWITKAEDGRRWLRIAKALRVYRDTVLKEFKEGI